MLRTCCPGLRISVVIGALFFSIVVIILRDNRSCCGRVVLGSGYLLSLLYCSSLLSSLFCAVEAPVIVCTLENATPQHIRIIKLSETFFDAIRDGVNSIFYVVAISRPP